MAIKKTAIITWHHYPNFGSALQAYALHHYINSHGGDATLINYRKGGYPSLYRFRRYVGLFDKFIPKVISDKLHYRFIRFEAEEFKQTRLIIDEISLNSLNSEFSTFICGSDQIWAPNVLHEPYLLSFVNDNKERYSYAASIGLSILPREKIEIYSKHLSRFNAISVREEHGAALLKSVFNLDATVVLDPTLLLDKNEWDKLSGKQFRNESYLFCYFLGENELHRKLVEDCAKKMGIKVICASRFPMDVRPSFTTDKDVGPREFLGYIECAELVVTDSFHGLCFSINFNKNFYVVERFVSGDPINQNSRIYNILSKLNLMDRLISAIPEKIQNINYEEVNKELELLRSSSKRFLHNVCEVIS